MPQESLPELRKFADMIVEVEQDANVNHTVSFNDAIHYLEIEARNLPLPMRVGWEVLETRLDGRRIHFRIITPDMEVTDELPARSQNVSASPTSSQTAG